MHARVISETDARKGLFGQGESAILMDARNALLGNGWTQGMGQIPDARNPSNPSPEHVGSIWAKPQHQIIENSNLHEFELQRPSNKGTKLLRPVTKAIINLPSHLKWYLRTWKLLFSSFRFRRHTNMCSSRCQTPGHFWKEPYLLPKKPDNMSYTYRRHTHVLKPDVKCHISFERALFV